MRVPADLLFVATALGAAVAGWLLVRSLFAFQREKFVYRCEAIFCSLHADLQAGVVSWSPKAAHLMAVARDAEGVARWVRPSVVRVLEREGLVAPPRPHAPKQDRARLAVHEQALLAAWVRLMLFGSPSGLLLAASLVPSVVRHMARRRRSVRRSLVRSVGEAWVRPVDPAVLGRLSAHAA